MINKCLKMEPSKENLSAFSENSRCRIRSYVRRIGRISTSQQNAINTLGHKFIIEFNDKPIDYLTSFGRNAPVKLEIGFGMGEATIDIAKKESNINFLAIDVHKPGIGKLIKSIQQENLNNIRIICHDAVDVLITMINDSSLAAVHIFFPDPWPKKKHIKRRIIQENFVSLLAKKIHPGGYVHCSTDWEPYAEHILNTFGKNHFFKSMPLPNFRKPDYRPNTKFELRGINLGYTIKDLIFHRQ